MRKGFLLAILLACLSLAGFAQDDNNQKLSVTTQMFLDELKGNISFDEPDLPSRRQAPGKNGQTNGKPRGKNHGRIIAAPDTVNGKVYISAFIRLDDNTSVNDLEALGVEVQCKFQNGLVTANIPVDKINDVAEISRVKRISVARRMSPLTNKVREASNVDDALTLSTDAIRAGLSNKYDGTGVVLGVVDTGIDFQHIAFKDKDGNSRIKRAYVYDGRSVNEYTSISSDSPTTDDSSEDHGTHTSSTAGGSSVIVNGSNVTVTDDHASATYGGMAPGADLYLAGINGLNETYLANAFQKICNYADSQNKPVVVSNSWGASIGPRDGTGDFADICAQYFSDSHPNHICLFAASNDAGTDGFHVSGTASSSKPVSALVRYNTDYVSYYYGIVADAWARSSSVSSLGCKVNVVNSNGDVQATVSVTPSSDGTSVSLGSTYVSSGSLVAYKNYLSSNKTEVLLYASSLRMNSGYYLRVDIYPTSGSSDVDIWAGTYTYFTNGSDDMCVSDEATIPDVISIGAYVTKNSVTDFNGTAHSLKGYYPTVGDIAYFSSYATADQSPTGLAYPWICAPGATTVAAVNHYDTSGDFSYINGNSAEYGMYRVNANTTNPYGTMEGTSMATPAAAGIVALWLQAAVEAGKQLSTSDVKQIMMETAINDEYTTGNHASHFGHGKLDALAGIQYILGVSGSPTIKVSPAEVSLTGYANETYTETITVTGLNLEADITASISGDRSFSIDKNRITKSAAADGAALAVTWKPTAIGQTSAVLTLKSEGADDVVVNISAKAVKPELIVDPEAISLSCEAGLTASGEFGVLGAELKGDVTATLDDTAGVFALSTTTITKAQAEEGYNIGITFAPSTVGTYTATVTLAAEDVEPVYVTVEATATQPVPVLSVSEQALSFSTDLTSTAAKTFTLTGRALTGDVNVELADAHQVFTVNPTTIAAADITAEGVEVTVSFQSPVEGTFQGSLTIRSEGVETITIALQGTASDGGTANDPFLNIAKYATIDEAGWNKTYVNTLYKYTTYENSEVAWLTMPVYGAWVGCYYNDHPQKWISTDVTNTSNKYYGTSWNGSDELLGSSPYFTGASGAGAPRVMGYNSRNNATKETVSFYVTNTTAVKLMGLGQSRTTSQYPTSLNVYECTKKADGTLEVSSTAVKSSTNSATSGTFILSADDLDAQKIYKVEAATYRSYIAEIAFQTPLSKPVVRGDVNGDGSITIADVTALVNIILETDNANASANDAADMNEDGSITIADVTMLVNMILGKE